MQHHVLVGRLGNDPKVRMTTTTNRRAISFSLAVDRLVKVGEVDGKPQYENQAQWFHCTAYGRKADAMVQFNFKKGDAVTIHSEHIYPSLYQGKEGSFIPVLEVIVTDFRKQERRKDTPAEGQQIPEGYTTAEEPEASE